MSLVPRLTSLTPIHQQPWCHRDLREDVKEILCLTSWRVLAYEPPVVKLGEALKSSGYSHVVVLAGGRAPYASLLSRLREYVGGDVTMTLTDRVANVEDWDEVARRTPGITYIADRVDPGHVPNRFKGVCTLISSLHHYEVLEVRRIIQDAVDNGEPIAIFESRNRNVLFLILAVMTSVAFSWLFLLTKRPFSPQRLLYTLVPILPWVLVLDGIISVIRLHRVEEVRRVVNRVKGAESYAWQSAEHRLSSRLPGLFAAPYLIGIPKKKKPE